MVYLPLIHVCTKTGVYYGGYMIKNARDQGPGRNNQACFAQLKLSVDDMSYIQTTV